MIEDHEAVWREIRRNREEAEGRHEELKELLVPLVRDVATLTEKSRVTEGKLSALDVVPVHEVRLTALETRRTAVNKWLFGVLSGVALLLAGWVAKIAWTVQSARATSCADWVVSLWT